MIYIFASNCNTLEGTLVPQSHLRSSSFVDVVFYSKEETFWYSSCGVIFFCSDKVAPCSFAPGLMQVLSNLTSQLRMTFLVFGLNNL
jgi:hypothetical protein